MDMHLVLVLLVRIQKLYFFVSMNINEENLRLTFIKVQDNYKCDQDYKIEDFFKKIKVKCTIEKEILKNKKQLSFFQKLELRKSLTQNFNFINNEIGMIENSKKETKYFHKRKENKKQVGANIIFFYF